MHHAIHPPIKNTTMIHPPIKNTTKALKRLFYDSSLHKTVTIHIVSTYISYSIAHIHDVFTYATVALPQRCAVFFYLLIERKHKLNIHLPAMESTNSWGSHIHKRVTHQRTPRHFRVRSLNVALPLAA